MKGNRAFKQNHNFYLLIGQVWIVSNKKPNLFSLRIRETNKDNFKKKKKENNEEEFFDNGLHILLLYVLKLLSPALHHHMNGKSAQH